MRVWLVLAIVGCGGGPSVIPTEPVVRLTNRVCSVQGGGFLVVDLDYQVTMDLGLAFQSTVGTGGLPGNDTFSCGSWSTTFVGGDNRGCERLDDFEPATQAVRHQFTSNLPNDPIQFSVAVLGSVVEFPGSNVMLANSGDTVECDVPPPP